MTKSKVLGMGNALVDILVRVENEDLLARFTLPKGSMNLVDRNLSDRILAALDQNKISLAPGGSAANTIHGLAKMGIETGYIGSVCQDEMGRFFGQDMSVVNIRPVLFFSGNPTGKAITLITPDTERTFATFLGAALDLEAGQLQPEMFLGYEYFYMEGYLVQNHSLVKRAMDLARMQGCTIVLDLASYNVVEANLGFLEDVVKKYVDVIFANEQEALAFTGEKPSRAVDTLAGLCSIAVVKTGREGSVVRCGKEKYLVPAIRSEVVDTTGAGDLYASGFLYGLIKGRSPEECGRIGSLLAARVIEGMGTKMTDDIWDGIRKEIAKN